MTNHLTLRRLALVAAGGLVAALSFGGVAQAITDSVFKYSSPKTGALMLSPADFVPSSTGSASDYSMSVTGGITTASAGQVCFLAPVHLPQAATITQLKAFHRRPDASDVVFVFLNRVNADGTTVQGVANGAQAIAPITVPAGGSVIYAANASTNVVNNLQFSYVVGLCIANNGRLISARVAYTFTTAGE